MCMRYTYIVPSTDRLHDLDDLLAALRVVVQRPAYRRRLLVGLDVPGGITALRLLRVVELLGRDGSPAIGDVAARLAIKHSTASRGVDAGVRAGLLIKESCAEDQRRARVRLTAEGRKVLKRTSSRRRQMLAQVTEGWSAADLDRMVLLLEDLREGFDRLEDSP